MSYISIDVDIDEFSDRDIIEEAIRRGLADQIVQKHRDATEPERNRKIENDEREQQTVDSLLHTAYQDAMGRRPLLAAAALRDALDKFVPAEMIEAWDALRDGRRDDAICHLDSVITARIGAARKAA